MIWVDQDGVLADFDGGYAQKFGVPPSSQDSPNEKPKWRNINSHPRFFAELPLTPFAKELWEILEPTGAHVLTAVAKQVPNCVHQKIEHLRRELGIEPHRVVAVWGRENKAAYCQKGDVLIDDRIDNIQAWEATGGIGYWFPHTMLPETKLLMARMLVDSLAKCVATKNAG